jgi:hypothetical protein
MILDRLDKLGSRERGFLLVAMICCFCWIVDALVISPALAAMAKLDLEIRTTVENLSLARRVLSRASTVRADYERVMGLAGSPRSPEEDTDTMNTEVDKLAHQTGVDCPSMGPGEPRSLESHTELRVDIAEFRSEAGNLVRFVHEIEQSPIGLRIAMLRISPDKGKGMVKGSLLVRRLTVPVVAANAEAAPDAAQL